MRNEFRSFINLGFKFEQKKRNDQNNKTIKKSEREIIIKYEIESTDKLIAFNVHVQCPLCLR